MTSFPQGQEAIAGGSVYRRTRKTGPDGDGATVHAQDTRDSSAKVGAWPKLPGDRSQPQCESRDCVKDRITGEPEKCSEAVRPRMREIQTEFTGVLVAYTFEGVAVNPAFKGVLPTGNPVAGEGAGQPVRAGTGPLMIRSPTPHPRSRPCTQGRGPASQRVFKVHPWLPCTRARRDEPCLMGVDHITRGERWTAPQRRTQ